MKTQKIGILYGGFSDEREVSLNSGKNVHRILSEGGYRTVLMDLQSPKDLEKMIHSHHIDRIFNVLHGLYGEDGNLQGDLNFLGIPYTGCGPLSSGVGMNKLMTKLMARGLGMATPEYRVLNSGHCLSDLYHILKSFPLPWFIKPVCGGSSRETYLVKFEEDIQNLSLNAQRSYLIEEPIEGIEVTSGVLTSQALRVIFPILSLISENAFYDYEAKYTEGKTKFLCPAPLSPSLSVDIGKSSMKMHDILGCGGATRCDYLIQKGTDKPYFLEINTSPGMTKLSDIPAEAKALGWGELELCERILESSQDLKN